MNVKLLFFPFSLLILIWSFVAYTKPGWDKYNTQKEELRTLTQKKQEIVAGVNKIKQASVKLQGLSDDAKSFIYNALPADVNNDDLVAEINKDASQAGVLVTKISTKKTPAKISYSCRNVEAVDKKNIDCLPGASSVTVNLMVVGTYPMVKDFLGKLDTQNRLINPVNFSLSTSESNNGEDNEEADSTVKLIAAKITFDVFQKKKNSKVVLSRAMDNDRVLKSLLTGGLNEKAIEGLNSFVTSPLFYPVRVDGAGKENLFE
jgi:Tfp pilus assembly protein PilO